MANKLANAENNSEGNNEDSLDGLGEAKELSGEGDFNITESKLKRLIRWANPQQDLILSVKYSLIGKSGTKDPFFKNAQGLDYRIPKRMVSVDEKYLRRCLELIHFRALRTARGNVSVNVSSEKMGFFSESISPSKTRNGDMFDSPSLVFECPTVAETGSVVISPAGAGQWILGSVMGSKSMKNILNSPLLQQYGALDSNANLTRINSNDVNDSICFDFVESPSALSLSSTLKLDMGTPIRERHKYGFDIGHKRLLSVSSTSSLFSDLICSSASTTINQGMLQCTWKDGNPHFVFSTDDQKDVYVANLWKVESKEEKALDYVYLFHSGKSGHKDHEICDGHSRLVGKMKVSNSFTLCPNDSKILETEFVLFSGSESYVTDMPTSSHQLRKSRGLSRKVAEVFRTSHSAKHKTISKFSGHHTILEESCFPETCIDRCDNLDSAGELTLLDDHPPPNLEVAAIIVKDHVPDTQKQEDGGWGLKFLKKVGVKKSTKSAEATLPVNCHRSNGDCSMSMDILIPAGLHGGPRTRNGGPSSLIERWKSGGHCDCGGWDMGCPLTVLKPRSSNDEDLPHIQEECKSFDLITQGSQNDVPTLRIVNVQDGLYFIHFQRTISVLQSFSIAVAIIHTRSPSLRPKDGNELK